MAQKWIMASVIIALLLTFGTTAAANSSILGPYGSGVIPITAHHTRMLSEVVSLSILTGDNPDPNYYYTLLDCHVHAKFDLISDQRQQFVIGFPLGPTIFGVNRTKIDPQDLTVTVDGRVIDFDVQVDVAADLTGGASERWATWEMEMMPGIIHTIIVDYVQPLHGYRLGSNLRMNYTLRTGSGWAEPIGAALITLTAPVPIEDHHIKPETTPGYTIEHGQVRWNFTDLQPDFDIEIDIDNILFVSDLHCITSALQTGTLTDQAIERGTRAFAAIVNERMNYGWETLAPVTGFSEQQFDNIMNEFLDRLVPFPSSPEAARYHVSLLAALFRADPDHHPRPELLAAMETALAGGYSLAWWDINEAAQAAAKLREMSADNERNERLARTIGKLIGGWADDPNVTCYVVWGDTIERSGLYTTLVRVSLHSDQSTRRFLTSGTDPVVNRGWSWLGPAVTFRRQLCPEQMGTLATAAIFYSAVSVAKGGRQLADDIAALDHIPGNEVIIQYTITPPSGVNIDHVPSYIEHSWSAEVVTISWPLYRLFWLVYLLPLVVVTVLLYRRRKTRTTLTS